MMPIGEVLRSERIRRNLQLEQISRELKIPRRLLEAIEGDKFDQLPAGVFARNFVRQYAQVLGLDGDEMAERAAAMFRPEPQIEIPEKDKPTVPEIRLPRMDEWESVGEKRFAWGSSLPALALVVVVMLLCSGVYAWWQRSRRVVSSSQAATPVARAEQKTAPAPPPATPAVPSPAGTLAQPGMPPAQPPSAPPAEPAASAASADRPTEPVKPQPVVEEIDPKAPVRVQLVAQGAVWVRAQVDGKYKFSATLQPNESRAVNGAGEVTVRVGNAGLLDIVLNGQSIGKLGPLGQVRTVQLTPGGFKIVAPEPKPASPPPPSEPL